MILRPPVIAIALAVFTAAAPDVSPGGLPPRLLSYLIVDAETLRVVDAHWDDQAQPLAVGSLIKPFTALAYADTHRFAYPRFTCRGTADGCWLPAGHGPVGIEEAVAGSCNAYFSQLARRTDPEVLAARLRQFGIGVEVDALTPASMVGYGDALKLTPSALIRGYLELASRTMQPGVTPIVAGLRAASRTGTGRGVGTAIGARDALVKTGTAPCGHVPHASADGYTIAIYPADRPRVALFMQAHGRTGADTARLAGQLLARTVATR